MSSVARRAAWTRGLERERVREADERGEVDADLGVDEPRAALAERCLSDRLVGDVLEVRDEKHAGSKRTMNELKISWPSEAPPSRIGRGGVQLQLPDVVTKEQVDAHLASLGRSSAPVTPKVGAPMPEGGRPSWFHVPAPGGNRLPEGGERSRRGERRLMQTRRCRDLDAQALTSPHRPVRGSSSLRAHARACQAPRAKRRAVCYPP